MQSLIRVPLFAALLLLAASLPGQRADGRVGAGKTSEQDPVLSPRGEELYFTRPDHKNNQGKEDAPDVWLRTRDESGGWNRAINPGSPINTLQADRALGFNPGGTLLAVLRDGGDRYIGILTKLGRRWEEVARTQVPEFVGKSSDIGYSVLTGELVFTTNNGPGNTDLYLTRPQGKGAWSTPEPITEANGDGNENRPFFAPDGRTLYFFRQGTGWLKQGDRGAEVTATRVSTLGQQFTVHLNPKLRAAPMIVGLSGAGLNAELRGILISERDLPRRGRLVTPATAATDYPLTSGIILSPQNLPGNRTLYLRDNERLVNGEELNDLDKIGKPAGGVRSDQAATTDDGYRGATNLDASLPPPLDTVPSDGNRGYEKKRSAELDAMKAKFREQQRLRQVAKDGGEITFRKPQRSAPPEASVVKSDTIATPALDGQKGPATSAPASALSSVTTTAPQPVLPIRSISFIPNTAYLNGNGYGGMDELLAHVNQARGVVKIHVHTSVDLPRRSAQLLSEERATTIRSWLLEQGIAPRHFRVLGYGNNLTGKGGERVEVY